MRMSQPDQSFAWIRGYKASHGRALLTYLLTLVITIVPLRTLAAQKITICNGTPPDRLVLLAKLNNFFAAEDLDLDLRSFPSGRQCLEAMFAGVCQIATVAETPIVHYSILRNDFLILASVSVADDFERILVRSDRGIIKPSDLKGHRIAVARYTAAHYFLDMYLLAHGLSPQDIKAVYLPPQEVLTSLKRGEVDAAAHWEPEVYKMSVEMGDKVNTFTEPGLHVAPFFLVGNRDFVKTYPAVITRVMRAIVKAETFNREQPIKARASLSTHFDFSEDVANPNLPLMLHRVGIDQTLPFLLENVARWEIGLMQTVQRPAIPNYLDFIYTDGLKSVKPAAVNLIH